MNRLAPACDYCLATQGTFLEKGTEIGGEAGLNSANGLAQKGGNARRHRNIPGEEQPQAPVQAGADLLESSSVERDWECWGTTG